MATDIAAAAANRPTRPSSRGAGLRGTVVATARRGASRRPRWCGPQRPQGQVARSSVRPRSRRDGAAEGMRQHADPSDGVRVTVVKRAFVDFVRVSWRRN